MKVSVYIPTHNRAITLRRAIDSVLAQSYKNIEIIVCDDGSADDTSKLMQDYLAKTSHIRYIKFDTPKGANAARNAAIRAASGDLVTGLDDDDEMLPNRIETLVKAYDEKYAFVSSRYFFYSNSKNKIKPLTIKRKINLTDLLYANIVGNQVLTSKEKFLKAGLFDESLPSGQDIDMWIRLLEKYGEAYIVSKPTMIVYDNPKGSITHSSKKFAGYFKLYRKHREKMIKNQRKYRLFDLALIRGRSFFYCSKLIPVHSKYLSLAIIKLFLRKVFR